MMLRHWPLLFCLALGAALSVAAGQDVSWDLQNYHLYNPVSVMRGRAALDFFPADKHSGLNPTLDFLYAWLALGPLLHYPRILAALMGLWYGAFVFIVLQLTKIIFAPYDADAKRILIPLCAATAATGALTWSQIGTTSNDIAIAMLVLAGLLCVLREKDTPRSHAMLATGFLFGLAAGAKLTAAVFAPALLVALIVGWPLIVAARACALFCAAWLAGFAVTFGWWGWELWQRFANPFFPMLNSVFHSRLGPQESLRDLRFFPHNLLQWIAYPFLWAFDSHSGTVYEGDFRDPRLALAFTALLLCGCLSVEKRGRRILTRPQKMTAVFAMTGYVAWLATTSILRYALVLEALSVLLFAAIVMQLGDIYGRRKMALYAVAALCALCLAVAKPPDWGHRPFADRTFTVDMSWVPQDALLLTLYEPVSYLAAFVPPEAHAQFMGLGFVSYLHGWPLGDRGEAMIRAHRGPIMIVMREERRPFLSLLPPLGLSAHVDHCRPIATDLALPDKEPVIACDVTRL